MSFGPSTLRPSDVLSKELCIVKIRRESGAADLSHAYEQTKCTHAKVDFDIAAISHVTLAFYTPIHKGQISAKCQKLEML